MRLVQADEREPGSLCEVGRIFVFVDRNYLFQNVGEAPELLHQTPTGLWMQRPADAVLAVDKASGDEVEQEDMKELKEGRRGPHTYHMTFKVVSNDSVGRVIMKEYLTNCCHR